MKLPTKERGQSLVEVLVALGVFVVGIASVGFLIMDAGATSSESLEQTKAILFAREGVAAVRSMRDGDFDNITAGIHGLALSGGAWTFSGTEDFSGVFARQVTVTDIDSDTKQIDSRVSWNVLGGRAVSYTLTDYLTDWSQTQGAAGQFSADTSGAALNSTGTILQGITISNMGSTAITIDRMIVSWVNAARRLNRIYIGGNRVYNSSQGAVSGTDINITNTTLNAGNSRTFSMNFSGSMINNDFIIKFVMTDGSTYYTLIENPDNTPDTVHPTVVITDPTANATYATVSSLLAIAGTASDDTAVTQVTWTNDRGGSGTAVGTDTWNISDIALQPGANSITVTASDAAGNTGIDVLTVTYTPADTIAPVVTITSPTLDLAYATSNDSITLGGTASDDTAVTQVTWTNDRGGSGTAVGTSDWTVAGIALQEGDNIITVTASDAAGNTGSDTLTVTYMPSDTAAPTIIITSPTPDPAYSTNISLLAIGGTASDNVAVTQVAWVNDRGGNGTAAGTTAWTVSNITLQEGVNVITVTASDAAGNTGTDILTVTYTLADTINPVITITSPTSTTTYATNSTPIALAGTASDNVAVTQVVWANNRGGSGTAAGTTAWTISSVALQPGANSITVTASDAAGNTGIDTLTVTYTPRHADYLVVDTTGITTNPSDRSRVTGITISNSHPSYNIVIASMTISWSGVSGSTRLNTIRINGANVWTGTAVSGAIENITDFTLVAGFGSYPINYLDFSRSMRGGTVNITFTMLDGTTEVITGLRP